MNIDKGFFETAAKGKSKAGKLKEVCQDAFFFTDGYFDFNDYFWKSGGEVIDDSRWYKDDFRVYPVLLDKFAFVKGEKNFLFFSSNSCSFYLDPEQRNCPIGNFICGENSGTRGLITVYALSHKDMIPFVLPINRVVTNF